MQLDEIHARLASNFARAACPCDIEALRRVRDTGRMFAQSAKLKTRPDLARHHWDAVDRADTRARLWQWRAVARTDSYGLVLTPIGEAILRVRGNG